MWGRLIAQCDLVFPHPGFCICCGAGNPARSRLSVGFLGRLVPRRSRLERRLVAVGMPVTRHPPHSPVLARLTHTVLALNVWRRSARSDTDVGSQSQVFRVLLCQRPFLHILRLRFPALVRLLRRYYAAVRLPRAEAKSRRAWRTYRSSLSPPDPPPCGSG